MFDGPMDQPAPTEAPAGAVQVRLMSSDPVAAKAAADRLIALGIIAVTGSVPNRRGPGIRVYGELRV